MSGSDYSLPVQPNPDPKPGRWILPVVILAMMGFAWLFINAADDPTVSASDTTSPSGDGGTATTTTTVVAETTTTTTLPPMSSNTHSTSLPPVSKWPGCRSEW